jgi:hypothetical protein
MSIVDYRQAVLICMPFNRLETENLREEGILRIPGSKEQIDQLKSRIDSGMTLEMSKYDANVCR